MISLWEGVAGSEINRQGLYLLPLGEPHSARERRDRGCRERDIMKAREQEQQQESSNVHVGRVDPG